MNGGVILIDRDMVATVPAGTDLQSVWRSLSPALRREARCIEFGGHFDLRSPLDLTRMREATILDWSHAKISAALDPDWADYPWFDAVGSTGLEWRSLFLIEGLGGAQPSCGVLLARHEDPKDSAGKHLFWRCLVSGNFRTAAIYSSDSEGNDFEACRLYNRLSTGEAALYIARGNPLGVVSPYGIIAPRSTASVCTMRGLYIQSASAGIVIDGQDETTIDATICSVTSSKSYVIARATRESIDGLVIRDLRGYGTVPIAFDIQGIVGPHGGMHAVIGVRYEPQQMDSSLAVRIGPVELMRSSFDWYHAAGLEVDARALLVANRFRGRDGREITDPRGT
jgi:hypothetical protein